MTKNEKRDWILSQSPRTLPHEGVSSVRFVIEKGVRSLTLEVRVSNVPAISLYKKYGMITQGLRKSYYIDNHEDAKIMTVDDIQSPDYRRLLNEKRKLLEHRLKN